eukprot:Nk52_evm19s304 gene=Nk52_evmTU19s304
MKIPASLNSLLFLFYTLATFLIITQTGQTIAGEAYKSSTASNRKGISNSKVSKEGSSGVAERALFSYERRDALDLRPGCKPIVFGGQTGKPKVVIEAFYDLLCSDTKHSWPKLKSAVQELGKKHGEGAIRIHFYLFPLPYHQYAYYGARGAMYAFINGGIDYFVKYMDGLLDAQADFLFETLDKTEKDLRYKFVDLVKKLKLKDIEKDFYYAFVDPEYDSKVRLMFKCACAYNVTGTPQYFVNGDRIEEADDYSKVSQWKSLLKKYLGEHVYL